MLMWVITVWWVLVALKGSGTIISFEDYDGEVFSLMFFGKKNAF